MLEPNLAGIMPNYPRYQHPYYYSYIYQFNLFDENYYLTSNRGQHYKFSDKLTKL